MKFPGFIKDKDFKNLLTNMLNKNIFNRIANLSQIKSNIWFNNFSWENLISLDMEVPYTRKNINKEIDQSKSYPYSNYLKVRVFKSEYKRIF